MPGRSRERLEEGGEAEKNPYVGERTRKGESAPRAGRPAPPSGGHRFGKGPRPPQRGPVERSERAGEGDRGEGGKGRWEGRGRKRVAENPESGGAGPSAERSRALLSGGRTVAPVKERGRAKPEGSAPTPSASMCKRDGRVGRERGGPSSGASEGRAPSGPPTGGRGAPRQGRRATVTGASGLRDESRIEEYLERRSPGRTRLGEKGRV